MDLNSFFPSRYLKAADFPAPQILTIDNVTIESVGQAEKAEDKPVLYFEGRERGVVLSRTTAEQLQTIFESSDTDQWFGKTVEVFHDPNVMYKDKIVGGIRFRKAPEEFPS